jgi:hypothetical protein
VDFWVAFRGSDLWLSSLSVSRLLFWTCMNLKEVEKGRLVKVTQDPPIPIYGVKKGDKFVVVENCMTSEPKAGLVCVELTVLSLLDPDPKYKYVYFNAEDFGRFVEVVGGTLQ